MGTEVNCCCWTTNINGRAVFAKLSNLVPVIAEVKLDSPG
jgi:hypothetical protein